MLANSSALPLTTVGPGAPMIVFDGAMHAPAVPDPTVKLDAVDARVDGIMVPVAA